MKLSVKALALAAGILWGASVAQAGARAATAGAELHRAPLVASEFVTLWPA